MGAYGNSSGQTGTRVRQALRWFTGSDGHVGKRWSYVCTAAAGSMSDAEWDCQRAGRFGGSAEAAGAGQLQNQDRLL